MRFWTTCAVAAALLGAAGVGAAVAPAAHGQSAPRAVAPRAFELLSTGGGRIGVSITDLDPAGAKGSGVLIEEVDEDSPAAKAGLKKGDIVVEFDGERVRSVRQFTRLVSETPAGRQVTAAVTRDGQRVSVNITPTDSSSWRVFDDATWRSLDELRESVRVRPAVPATPKPPRPPATPKVAPIPPAFEGFFWTSGNQLGVTVNSLSDQLKDYFGTKGGVLVTSVTEDSTAARAGVKAGDVIVSVNGANVDDPADLRREVQRLDAGEEVTLSIVRDKKPMTLKGKVEQGRSRRNTVRTIL